MCQVCMSSHLEEKTVLKWIKNKVICKGADGRVLSYALPPNQSDFITNRGIFLTLSHREH